MHWRILLSVPTVLIVWWFGWRITMPGPDNWLIWLMTADTAAWWRAFWLATMFTGTIVIIASLTLFAKKNTLAFIGVAVIAYAFAWLYGMGSKASGHIMDGQGVMNDVTPMGIRGLTEREELIFLRAEREFERRQQVVQPPMRNNVPWYVAGGVACVLGLGFMMFSFSSWIIGRFVIIAETQAGRSHELAMAAVQSAPAKTEGGIVLGAMLALAAIFIIIGLIRGGR